jgi:hypothetical protein
VLRLAGVVAGMSVDDDDMVEDMDCMVWMSRW